MKRYITISIIAVVCACNAQDAIHPTNQERRGTSNQTSQVVGNGNTQVATTTQQQNTVDSKTSNMLAIAQVVGQVSAIAICAAILIAVSYIVFIKMHNRVRKRNGRKGDKAT